MYSTFNQRVNANVEKLLNGASPYKVCLEAETRQEILQSLKNYEIIKQWREDRDHEEYMEECEEAWNQPYDSCLAFSWQKFEDDTYSEDEYYYSYSDFWNEFCTKFDEIQNGIAEDLPSLPSDRELWLMRQARKAAEKFGYGYWNTGMKKAWPVFARKYLLTSAEADKFWIEYYQYLNQSK